MKRKTWELNHPLFRLLQHLAFWTLSFFVFLHLFKTGANAEKVDYVYTALFQATIIPAVYINLKLLLPRFSNFHRWLIYIPIIAALLLFFSWFNLRFFESWSARLFPGYFFISYFTFKEVLLFFTIYIIITTLLKLSKSWFAVSWLQKELLEKEKQKTEAELKALKAQLNPHFFFNTLNNIYSMSLKKDERLPETVLQLSDLMRYFLYESKDNYVPLEKELASLDNYIALQRLRSGKHFQLEIERMGEAGDRKIAPLLLITFLENAFKHGAKGSSGDTFIKLFIGIEKDELNFVVENNKGSVDEVRLVGHSGLGLENVKRQLVLLYPSRHTLKIKDEPARFIIQLQLHL